MHRVTLETNDGDELGTVDLPRPDKPPGVVIH